MSGTTLPGRLITLVRRRDKPVCVMLPGAGGGLTPYLRLASHLGKTHSVYAVRAAGLLPDEAPEETVAQMADSAVEALDGLSPALVFGWYAAVTYVPKAREVLEEARNPGSGQLQRVGEGLS